MIYSEQHGYLFDALPNTASSAVSVELCENYGGRPILRKHSHLNEADCELGRDTVDGLFKFCGVRNPLDMWVTRYLKLRNDHDGVFSSPKKWARNGGWVSDDKLEMFQFVQSGKNFSEFVRQFPNSAPVNKMNVVRRCDFVMRYEEQPNAFAQALQACGIAPVRDLPVINATKNKRNFLEYYDSDEVREAAVLRLGKHMRNVGYDLPDGFPEALDPG